MKTEQEIKKKLKEREQTFRKACKNSLNAQMLFDIGFISALKWVLGEEE